MVHRLTCLLAAMSIGGCAQLQAVRQLADAAGAAAGGGGSGTTVHQGSPGHVIIAGDGSTISIHPPAADSPAPETHTATSAGAAPSAGGPGGGARPLVSHVAASEGYAPEPYEIGGDWHVCYGHRVDAGAPEMTDEECIDLLADDMAQAMRDARRAVGEETWRGLTGHRQAALAELALILGLAGLMEFEAMLEAVRDGDYGRAAYEIFNSLLPEEGQIGPRRTWDIAERMRGP